MSRGPTHRVVVEAFPVPGADAFEDYVCAAITCWVHPVRSNDAVDLLVRQKLADIGWQLIRVDER